MKKTFLTMVITTSLMVTIYSDVFAQEPLKKAEACKPIVIKDEKKLIQFRLDSYADYNEFKAEADKRIAANEIEISNLKTNKPIHDTGDWDLYHKKVMALQEKSDSIKLRIEESFQTKTCAWPTFKTDFDRDMDALELEIKNIQAEEKK